MLRLPIAIALFLALAASAPAGADATSVLRTDPKLAEPVTVRAVQEPLIDLIAQIGKSAGVALDASPDTADEPVTVFAKRRPAHEILARLAEHLDYSWVAETRKGVRTLILIQDQAAKQRQKALAGSTALEYQRKWVEESVSRLAAPEAAALARLPREERLRRIQETDTALRGMRVATLTPDGGRSYGRIQPDPPHSDETRKRLNQELELLQLVSPEARQFSSIGSVAIIYPLLSAEQREALWSGAASFDFSFPPEEGRLPLPANIAEQIAAGPLGNHASRDDEATGLSHKIPFEEMERVRISIGMRSDGDGPQVQAHARILGSFGDGQISRRLEMVFSDEAPTWSDAAHREFRIGEECAELDDPVPPITPDVQAPKAEEAGLSFEDVLERLADAVPYPLVADGYTSSRSASFSRAAGPLSAMLPAIAKTWRQSVRFGSGWLRFRHADWAVKRREEPPARLTRRCIESLRAFGGLRLAEKVEIAGRLGSLRLETLESRLTPLLGASWSEFSTADANAFWRMLHVLPRGQRQTLDGGGWLSFRSLAPELRPAALRLV